MVGVTLRRDSASRGLFFFLVLQFLDSHIAKLVGIEDFAAVKTLNVFGVLFTRYYANLGVLADRIHGVTDAA